MHKQRIGIEMEGLSRASNTSLKAQRDDKLHPSTKMHTAWGSQPVTTESLVAWWHAVV